MIGIDTGDLRNYWEALLSSDTDEGAELQFCAAFGEGIPFDPAVYQGVKESARKRIVILVMGIQPETLTSFDLQIAILLHDLSIEQKQFLWERLVVSYKPTFTE